MIARLRLFLLLWLPGLVTLLAGLPIMMRTGQVTPMDWALPGILLFAIGGWLGARRGWPVPLWMAAGGVMAVLLFCALATGRWPGAWPAVAFAMATLLVTAAVLLLSPENWLRSIIFLLTAAAILWTSRPQPIAPTRDRPGLAILTGLPLFWQEGEAGPQSRADAPVIDLLRQRFTVHAIDSPSDPILARIDRLLIAQPRAMTPSELVAIDAWVREGGRALVLADPLLRWPSPLPVGDRRRPPPVTLLGPLLDHWGVTPRDSPSLDERRLIVDDGALMTVLSASTLSAPSHCASLAQGYGARCRIGRGEAVVIADADLIDDRLWLGDPANPRDTRQWTADNAALVTRWLGGTLAGERRWLVDAAHLGRAILWSVLAGFFWAGMGMVLLTRKSRHLRGPAPPGHDQSLRVK